MQIVITGTICYYLGLHRNDLSQWKKLQSWRLPSLAEIFRTAHSLQPTSVIMRGDEYYQDVYVTNRFEWPGVGVLKLYSSRMCFFFTKAHATSHISLSFLSSITCQIWAWLFQLLTSILMIWKNGKINETKVIGIAIATSELLVLITILILLF